MATPFVTGLIGYMLSFNETLSPDQIKTVLEESADDKGVSGWDESYGAGRVDVLAAADMVKNDLPVSGSVYSPRKLSVSVLNTSASYDSGITGHASAVIGQAVYLYDSSGAFVSAGLTSPSDGSIDFNLLKPGSYTLETGYFGDYQSQEATLGTSADAIATLSFDKTIVLIQTLPNDYYNSGSTAADTVITLYDSSQAVVAGPYDSGTLDTLIVGNLESGATYYVKVEPFEAGTIGYYGLDIGTTGETSVDVADSASSPGTGFVDALGVSLNTDYGFILNNATNEDGSFVGEWFTFTAP